MRMKCLRIFPETIPRISRSELSSFSLNMALGNAVVTVASISIGSLLATIFNSWVKAKTSSPHAGTHDVMASAMARQAARLGFAPKLCRVLGCDRYRLPAFRAAVGGGALVVAAMGAATERDAPALANESIDPQRRRHRQQYQRINRRHPERPRRCGDRGARAGIVHEWCVTDADSYGP